MNSYNLNTLVRLSVSFKDTNGVLIDPTTVTVSILDPTEASVAATVVKDSVGTYHADVTPALFGVWDYTFAGTGAVVATGQASFFVEPAL